VFVQQSLQPKLPRRCYGSVSEAVQNTEQHVLQVHKTESMLVTDDARDLHRSDQKQIFYFCRFVTLCVIVVRIVNCYSDENPFCHRLLVTWHFALLEIDLKTTSQ